jgi:uncharacterized membrane protein YhaH (DUF805 family)/predicted RNA-binding Zn-ribbon protein involved in translation (DUF1610 family)
VIIKEGKMGDTWEKAEDEMYCSSCGEIIKQTAEICPKCGVRLKPAPAKEKNKFEDSKKNGFEYFVDAMKKYAVFRGRARRAEFWWFTLFLVLISCVAEVINAIVFTEDSLQSRLFSNIVSLVFLLPNLAVSWRRMHDLGKSGAYTFVPIYSIILFATAGVAGPNEYGPDPKQVL